jgi:hypothetical protein
MRWIASIVATVCLLAAGGVRPAPDLRSGHQRDVRLAPASAPAAAVATHRRDGARADLRLAPFALAASTEPPVPPPARIAAVACTLDDVSGATPPPPCSRGPPRG